MGLQFQEYNLVPLVYKKKLEYLSDAELLERIQKGEKALLNELYERYKNKVYRKCLGMVRDEAMAMDLAHDIFIKVFTKLNSLKEKSNLSAWIFSITYNHCINFIHTNKKTIYESSENPKFEEVGIDEIEAENVELKELKLQKLEVLMDELHPQERVVLLMRYQDGLSVKQIARMLDIGESAVKMRLKRSRDKLANLFKSNDDE